MTDDDGSRRRVRSPLAAVRSWWQKRSASQRTADLAAKVAASTAAKLVAGLVATTTVVAAAASIPDTLDGPDLPASAEERLAAIDVPALELEAAALRDALDAVQSDLAGLLAQMDDVDIPDLTGLLTDVAAAESTLAALRDRVADVQAVIDATSGDILADVSDLGVRLDAVAADVAAARAVADRASVLATEVANAAGQRLDMLTSDVDGLADGLAAQVDRIDALAGDVHDLAVELADTQVDVEGLLSRVSDVEADVAQLSGRTSAVERLTSTGVYSGFTPTTMDEPGARAVGPTFDTVGEALVTVTVYTADPQGTNPPEATLYVVRTDDPWAGYDWSTGGPDTGTIVHTVALPADASWRLEVECESPCVLGTGHAVVQPTGTLD